MIEHGGSRWLVAGVVVMALGRGAIGQPVPPAEAPPASSAATIDNSLIPALTRVIPPASTREEVSSSLQIFILMTVLTIAPAILVMTTSFVRIILVLALLRQAMATNQLPPHQVLIGLSLFLTLLVMGPTYDRIYKEAVVPWLDHQDGMTQRKALDIADAHMREFMFDQIDHVGNEEDIFLFLEYQQKRSIPTSERIARSQVDTRVLIPAFMLSEVKTAFVMGFRFYLPFLVIDMVIATILISMGMLMLPPVMISLPFKLLMFVLADGWHLVISSLLTSFG